VFGRGRGTRIKESAVNASEVALRLAQDKKFRKRLISAIEHGSKAGRRTRRSLGLTGAVTRLARDQALRAELKGARDDLQHAYARLDRKKRSHKLRNLALLAGLASLARVPQVRERATSALESARKYGRRPGDPSAEKRAEETPDDSSRPGSLDDLTKEELYARAQEADISGRSEMSKDELVAALRRQS
jgi:hypothetical protein